VEVTAAKGWFETVTPAREYRKCEEIRDGIKRHVDDVESVYVNQKYAWHNDEHGTFDSLYDALEYTLEGPNYGYRYRYERPSDNGVGTSGRADGFKELIETAYRNPHKFELIQSEPPLTDGQQEFLERVLEAALSDERPKATDSTESA
jgi:hypothetical protein